MTVSRRQMLKLSAGATTALAFGRAPSFAQDSSIRTRPTPSSGERIPVVGLGTARTFNVGATEDERAPLRDVLREFVNMGGRLLDTAPGYRNSEGVSGDLARDIGATDEMFWATKVRAQTLEQEVEQMQGSMDRLHTEQIDLMQIHNVQRYDQAHLDALLATLREWKADDRYRYIGITTSSTRAHDRFHEIMESETLDFVQLNYSIGTRQAEEKLLPLAVDRGMAVIVNVPYERARLFQAVAGQELPEWAAEYDIQSWGQFFLKYLLSNPSVTCVIPATTKVHHLQDNMGAGYGGLPDEAGRVRMVEYFESVR